MSELNTEVLKELTEVLKELTDAVLIPRKYLSHHCLLGLPRREKLIDKLEDIKKDLAAKGFPKSKDNKPSLFDVAMGSYPYCAEPTPEDIEKMTTDYVPHKDLENKEKKLTDNESKGNINGCHHPSLDECRRLVDAVLYGLR